MEIKNIKQKARNLIDKLPDNSTWDDLMYEITKKRKKEPQRHKEHKDFLTHNFLVGTILQKHRGGG